MKILPSLALVAFMIAATAANAETIVACGEQKGHAYYPEAGLVPKDKAGWINDQISDGSTTLTQDANGDFDVLFKDSRGEVISSRDDGREIILIRKSINEIAVLVVYPSGAQAAEIYSFICEADGGVKMLQLSSKGLSVGRAVPKAGVYVAKCTTFNLR